MPELARAIKPIFLARNLHSKELRREIHDLSSFVQRNAIDIVDTWRVEHIVNAIRIYTTSAAIRVVVAHVPAPPEFPTDAPDTDMKPVPSGSLLTLTLFGYLDRARRTIPSSDELPVERRLALLSARTSSA